MPFALNTRISPIAGRAGEVRGLLEEWVRGPQGQGLGASLVQRIVSPEGTGYGTRIVLPDLAALERTRDRLLADQGYLATVARLESLSREPIAYVLNQVLVPMAQAGSPGRYVGRSLAYPAAGREREMRGLLTEFVQRRQADGVTRLALSAQIYNPTGGVLQVARGAADMAEVERNLIDTQTNPLTIELGAKIAAMSRQPITRDLLEILIQAPS